MKTKQKKRNVYAIDPIMRKGGVHEKSTKAKRQKDRMKLQKEAANWQPYFFVLRYCQLANLSVRTFYQEASL
ncbi:hypothetical protein [Gynuella sunshinyii]|uniref:Uncharacterized protein n=1 Tax=Gynuella sunshinyii YC6258 TaxID=1445510 RepID=A0A0C5VDR9_9GAMM|nr:hypothetical protein [Gynuella sunshinyii]AJQ92346.1 hypothetical Protein YC6258_00296 [Gynuella sunshinyii YC6258]